MANRKKKINVYNFSQEDFARGGLKSDRSAADLTAALAEANGFDLSYLADNSRGELSPGQMGLLTSPILVSMLFFLVTGGVVGFQLYQQGFLKKIISGGLPLSKIISGMPTGTLVMGIILLVISLVGLYFLILAVLDLIGRSVLSLEGPGWKKITTSTDDDGSTTTRTYYVVGEQRFSVKKRGYGVLENGRTYRVYFTPRRKILVNIEALD
jgi:hypothetical protein